MKINIDQFTLGSKKKEWAWFWKRQHKPAYFLNRLQWFYYPPLHHISRFPLHVDFETSSICNMNCPMCFRPHRANQNDGLLDFEVYKKVIDECSKYNLYSIRLSWRGEPTKNPDLLNMAEYAKKKGIKEVSFLTNGLLLDEEFSRRLAEIRVDYISVSIDGLYKDYEKIRKPATFNGILNRLKYLKEVRDSIGKGYPRIKVNTIWTKIKDRIEEYYSIFGPLADIISFNPDYDYSEKSSPVSSKHICQYPWQRLTVKWNGDVPMCISDWDSEVVLGNVKNNTLHSIWHGEKMNEIRKNMLCQKILNYAPCRKCHRPTTEQIGNVNPVK